MNADRKLLLALAKLALAVGIDKPPLRGEVIVALSELQRSAEGEKRAAA